MENIEFGYVANKLDDKSSHISAIGFDESKDGVGTLYVEYYDPKHRVNATHGTVYTRWYVFYDVTRKDFEELCSASSIGSTMHNLGIYGHKNERAVGSLSDKLDDVLADYMADKHYFDVAMPDPTEEEVK